VERPGERCQQERAKTLDEMKQEIVGRGAKRESGGVNTQLSSINNQINTNGQMTMINNITFFVLVICLLFVM